MFDLRIRCQVRDPIVDATHPEIQIQLWPETEARRFANPIDVDISTYCLEGP
jgi:hypothetical protein